MKNTHSRPKGKALERLEAAEKEARDIWRSIGVDRPTAAELSKGILFVLAEGEEKA